ncbi:MAG: O-antigen ligase family protein [Paludibacteraceae bacterium]
MQIKSQNTYLLGKDIIAYIPVLGLLMLVAAMPFGFGTFQRMALYVLAIGFVLDYAVNRRWTGWHWTRDKWMYVSMLLLFLLFPVWQLWDTTPPTGYFYHQLNRHSMFAVVAIVGIGGFSDKIRLKYVGYVMLLTGLYIVFANTYYYCMSYSGMPFSIDLYNEVRAECLNSHMVVNLYLNTAFILGFFMLRLATTKTERLVIVLLMVIVCGYVLISVGRAGFITLLLIIGIFSVCYVRVSHSWKMYAGMAVLSGGMVLLFLCHPRLHSSVVMHNSRFAVWEYTWHKITERPICGYGVSTFSDGYLQEMYRDEDVYNGFIRGLLANPKFAACGKTMMTHHPHNTFLTNWVEFGVMGLLALVFFLLTAAFMPSKEYRIYVWTFLIALMVQMLFEPLGDHLQPQFIAIMLFAFQQSCRNRELSGLFDKDGIVSVV